MNQIAEQRMNIMEIRMRQAEARQETAETDRDLLRAQNEQLQLHLRIGIAGIQAENRRLSDENEQLRAMLDLRKISLDWEQQTGNDSLETIERVYERSPEGAYVCVWPKCSFSREDAAELWRHVHTAHGEWSLPPILGHHKAPLDRAEQP